ncbi:hypothetical protein GCM10007919_15400 [Rhizobium indigoferae]|nr:hypothetical protein GCM10007919_15400 [Rhizobium indigoferae]
MLPCPSESLDDLATGIGTGLCYVNLGYVCIDGGDAAGKPCPIDVSDRPPFKREDSGECS